MKDYNFDKDIQKYLDLAIQEVHNLLMEKLVGIYLYGSLAMGSYYKPKSDIDLIIVVKSELSTQLKKELAHVFVKLADQRPTVGNLEVSVITQHSAAHFIHPCPFEVHYSTEWHQQINENKVDFSLIKTDPDLAAHLTYITKRGIVLYGQDIQSTFGDIPWQYFIDSILDDFNWIVEAKHILESPFYSVLNICRVMRTLNENTESVYSKDEGGEWALSHLPSVHKPLIEKALRVYRSSEAVNESQRRTGGVDWDRDQLLQFRDFAKKEVENLHA